MQFSLLIPRLKSIHWCWQKLCNELMICRFWSLTVSQEFKLKVLAAFTLSFGLYLEAFALTGGCRKLNTPWVICCGKVLSAAQLCCVQPLPTECLWGNPVAHAMACRHCIRPLVIVLKLWHGRKINNSEEKVCILLNRW